MQVHPNGRVTQWQPAGAPYLQHRLQMMHITALVDLHHVGTLVAHKQLHGRDASRTAVVKLTRQQIQAIMVLSQCGTRLCQNCWSLGHYCKRSLDLAPVVDARDERVAWPEVLKLSICCKNLNLRTRTWSCSTRMSHPSRTTAHGCPHWRTQEHSVGCHQSAPAPQPACRSPTCSWMLP